MDIRERLKTAQTARHLKPEDLDIRGSGITKRELERTSKAYDRETEKTLTKGGDLAAKEAEKQFKSALDETTAALEREAKAKNIILDFSQIRALRGVLQNQVCCLIGAAGTGKTTLERMIISELAKKVPVVELKHDEELDEESDEDDETEKTPGISVSAFTGRAAQQARKAIGGDFGIPIQTIHSLLGYAPTLEEFQAYDQITRQWYTKTRRVFRPTFGKAMKLPYAVYIIDEASMVPIPLFNELIDAMHPSSRIILIGDIHQLPPVYGKSVLGYALKKWPTFQLETIHRQAAGNPIIANAHRILQGKSLQPASNVVLMKTGEAGSTGFSVYIRQVVALLSKKGRFDPYRDVIIVANSNPEIITSAPALNEFFVTFFNPERKVNGVIINKRFRIHTGTQEVHFAVGDKVMINQNINTVNPPITNGMMGVVKEININAKYDMKRAADGIHEQEIAPTDGPLEEITLDNIDIDFQLEQEDKEIKQKEEESLDQRQASHAMSIEFETGQNMTCVTAGDFRKISFGYAITCHKSQGGEYANVVICIHSANGQLLTQEWLYTAFTRAKNNVYLLHNEKGLRRALSVQKIKGNSLAEKINSYVIETHSDDVDLKGDPWNVDRTKFPILFNPKQLEK